MEQNTVKEKKIKTRWIRRLAALATLLILFSVGFWGLGIMLDDTEYLEDQFTALNTAEEMGMTIPDLSRATSTLFDYMKGRKDSIKISVRQNGQMVEDLFYHPKEVVHMEEVRELWRTLTVVSILGMAAAGGCIAAIVFFGRKNTRLRPSGTGMIVGVSIFAGIILAALLWAISDFNSFWTVFHFIIFPSSLIQYLAGGLSVEAYNSLNWVFDSDYAMIRMLDDLFPALVLRAGILFAAEIGVVLLIGIILNRRGRKLDQAGLEIVEVRQVTTEERYVPVEDAPDLVLQHKLQNASLRQKRKMMEELRKTPEQIQKEQEEKEAEAQKAAEEESREEPEGSLETQTQTGKEAEGIAAMGSETAEEKPEAPDEEWMDKLPGTADESIRNRLITEEETLFETEPETEQSEEHEKDIS